jgi:hypothetical protein
MPIFLSLFIVLAHLSSKYIEYFVKETKYSTALSEKTNNIKRAKK